MKSIEGKLPKNVLDSFVTAERMSDDSDKNIRNKLQTLLKMGWYSVEKQAGFMAPSFEGLEESFSANVSLIDSLEINPLLIYPGEHTDIQLRAASLLWMYCPEYFPQLDGKEPLTDQLDITAKKEELGRLFEFLIEDFYHQIKVAIDLALIHPLLFAYELEEKVALVVNSLRKSFLDERSSSLPEEVRYFLRPSQDQPSFVQNTHAYWLMKRINEKKVRFLFTLVSLCRTNQTQIAQLSAVLTEAKMVLAMYSNKLSSLERSVTELIQLPMLLDPLISEKTIPRHQCTLYPVVEYIKLITKEIDVSNPNWFVNQVFMESEATAKKPSVFSFMNRDLRAFCFSELCLNYKSKDKSFGGVNFDGVMCRGLADGREIVWRDSTWDDTVDFSFASCRGADFSYRKMRNWNFSYAQLQNAQFNLVQIENVNFSGADLTGAVFSIEDGSNPRVTVDKKTILPNGERSQLDGSVRLSEILSN